MTTITNKPASQEKFRIMIEASAVMDYMTMLRGLNASGDFFPGFISDQLTRFPDFQGKDWKTQLPSGETLETVLAKAAQEQNFFHRVRPYDFAQRDLLHLQQRGIEIVFYVPDLLQPYINDIREWVTHLLPSHRKRSHTRVVGGDLSDIRTEANVWVARSPQLGQWLRENHQPFMFIDGKENGHMRNVLRVPRWDMLGYALRHAHALWKESDKGTLSQRGLLNEDIAPHLKIWGQYRYIPAELGDALNWVGLQLDSFRKQQRLSPDQFIIEGTNDRYTENQLEKMFECAKVDIAELHRKATVLENLRNLRDAIAIENPRWWQSIETRERKLRRELHDVEVKFGISPQTGQVKKRLKGKNSPSNLKSMRTSYDLPLSEKLTIRDFIRLMSEYRDLISLDDLPKEESLATGMIAEQFASALLKNNKYDILKITNEQDQYTNENNHNRITVQWTDNNNKERCTEVDCIAEKDEKMYVIEVKLAYPGLSAEQNQLRNHLSRGGTIRCNDLIELGDFQAEYKRIVIDTQAMEIINGKNPISR